MNEWITALSAAAKKKQVMAVYRDDTGDSWSGIPVMTGPALVVLARERDFALDGYLAVAAGQITGVEQYDDKDRKELLAGIQKAFDGWCIAECAGEEGELFFYVGRLERLEPNCLVLRPVDAEGRWVKEPVEISYEDLCTVSFGGNYLRVYRKYTGGK